MLTKARSFLATNRDASQLVARAKKISIKVPGVGKIGVPPPDQLAFFGVLGVMAAVNVLEWPVALAIGVAEAVAVRQFGNHSGTEGKETAAPAKKPPATTSANKTPAKARPAKATAADNRG
jgi:xanthosine utilization system XapX-like protein